MRQLIIIQFFLVLISCSTEKQKSSLTKMRLNGSVQKVIERYYGAQEKFGEPEKTYFELMIEYEFDKKGNLIKLSRYDRFENLEYRQISKFDDNQRQIELSHYNMNGDLEYKDILSYDATGNTTETRTYDSYGKLTNKQTDIYSLEGLKIEMITYDQNEIQNIYKYSYDSVGEIILIKRYSRDGILLEEKSPIKFASGFGFEKFTNSDKHENWLKASNSRRICEREISYF